MKASQITALDFLNDLSSEYARKRFFWFFIIFITVTFVISVLVYFYFPAGPYKDIIYSFFTQITTSLSIIWIFYLFYWYFLGDIFLDKKITVILPHEIQKRVDSLGKSTNEYLFWGRSGSYFRSVMLEKLASGCRTTGNQTDVKLVLPNPKNPKIIERYAELVSDFGESANANTLLINVLSTCITCAIAHSTNSKLRIEIYISQFLPAFRVDQSITGSIMTQDNPSKSAMFFDGGSEFHSMFRNSILNEIQMASQTTWNTGLFKDVKKERGFLTKEVLDGITFPGYDKLSDEVNDEQLRAIENIVLKPTHRY